MIAQWVQACEVQHVGCDDYCLPRGRVRVVRHLPEDDLVSDRPAVRP
ncbi:MAG: hypothetical protein WBN99_05755 [Mycobacterium sp.]|nr:hypothetical protein [Mycobacterium sp.]